MKNERENTLVYTIPELSAKLKISRSIAYKLAKSKDFPKVLIGKRILIPDNELRKWLERQCNV